MQYFASFEPFEIFDEFNMVQVTYLKSFPISDILNLNKYQATHEANLSNLDTFLGRPGIHYVNTENGKGAIPEPHHLRNHYKFKNCTVRS